MASLLSKKGIHRVHEVTEHNSCYCHNIPILRVIFFLQSSCSSAVLLPNTMGLNAAFHFVYFHHTARADFDNAGQHALSLHGMRTSGNCLEENCQIKISPTPLFGDFAKFNACQIFTLYSITQVLRLFGCRNLGVFCKRSELAMHS